LTKLYNREKFKLLFDFMVKKSRRNEDNIVLAILDIDFFKKVNDTFGHLVGDTVLKELADILRKSLRDSDIVARWGGEEFVLALCVKEVDEAKYILEKLRKNIENYHFSTVEKLTCSCGYTLYKGSEENDTVFQRADEALYKAKINGRNRVEAKI
jgi:diguanylate cyclase (GGDEF)-like protein